MSLEASIAALTAAVEENTKIQTDILAKLNGGGASAASETPSEEPKPTRRRRSSAATKSQPKGENEDQGDAEEEVNTEEKPKAKPAARRSRKKKVEVEIRADGVSLEEIRGLGVKLTTEGVDKTDTEERDRRKGLMKAAFDHIGVSKISDLDEEGRIRAAYFFEHWIADMTATLDLEALDEAVLAVIEASAGDEDEDDEDDDDMLG